MNKKHPITTLFLIELIIHLKTAFGLKVAAISDKGRELNEYRIKQFRLDGFINFFTSSSIIKLRKPDIGIFNLVLDIAQLNAGESIYINNQQVFVEVTEGFGMKGISHIDQGSTEAKLNAFGLKYYM